MTLSPEAIGRIVALAELVRKQWAYTDAPILRMAEAVLADFVDPKYRLVTKTGAAVASIAE